MEHDIETRLAAAGETLTVDALAVKVFRALTGAGVECRLLKGASFARWLYDDGSTRTYRDCDYLVSPEGFDAAEGVLQRLGFSELTTHLVEGDRPQHDTVWVDPATKLIVELHRTLPGATAPPDVVWGALAEPKGSVVVLGHSVDALSIPGRALHSAIHVAQHGPEIPRCREDLARALEKTSAADWESAAELARRIGATPAFALGLRSAPSGERVASRLELPTDAPTDLRLMVSGAPATALGFDWLSSRKGLGAKAALLLRKAFPPPLALRDWLLTRRSGRPLPLALAYAWRIGWLLRHAPAGYRAWRKSKTG